MKEPHKPTEDERQHMLSTVSFTYQNRHDQIWINAFAWYNKNNPDRCKGMGCSPCYGAVLNYLNGGSEIIKPIKKIEITKIYKIISRDK
jgi:hypothetical protein